MDRDGILKIVRTYLYDKNKRVWSDDELYSMIGKAVESYAEDTGSYRSTFSFYRARDGKYHYPDDYIYFQAGWNKSGGHIIAESTIEIGRHYSDYLVVKGLPVFIYDDLDNPGTFRLCPDPVNLLDTQYAFFIGEYGEFLSDKKDWWRVIDETYYPCDSAYGTMLDDSYGLILEGADYGTLFSMIEYVFAGDYGTLLDDNYGVPIPTDYYGTIWDFIGYQFTGDISYSRYASTDEITDYMALVYHVLSQAYDTDADWGDASRASQFSWKYKSRVDSLNQIKYSNYGKRKSGIFY